MADFVERTGKTVEEAIEAALFALRLPKDRCTVEVIEEPSNGFFGLIGKRDAKVRVTAKEEPLPQPQESLPQKEQEEVLEERREEREEERVEEKEEAPVLTKEYDAEQAGNHCGSRFFLLSHEREPFLFGVAPRAFLFRQTLLRIRFSCWAFS